MFDLSKAADRKALSERIKDDINDYCVAKYPSEHRNHLGASEMGDTCPRRLFYKFRWVKLTQFSGRMQRLFQVGHTAEPRFVDYLRGIGFEVWEKDPATDKQFRISGHNGHYGGSLDGICKAPARYEISEDLAFLNEFKTNATGSGFANVATKGVQKEKPKHWAQMCQYGFQMNLKYGLYLIENKNDSDLTPQIVELDWKLGQEMSNRAGDIINAKLPPARVSETPAYHDCKYCDFSDICHNNEPVEKNCRSCKFADPVEEGNWFCNRWNSVIPKDNIKDGCDGHTSINN